MDDPEPTGLGHWEIYLFTGGASARDGWNGSAGVDFNYGAAQDLQLTAVLPVAWDTPIAGPSATSLGNIELAAKYKFLHQQDLGVDVAVFPRVFLPAGSSAVGERHVSLLLPIWIQYAWDKWTIFGGGGCEINRGEGSQDFCIFGGTATVQLTPKLQIGAEIYHQTADTKDGRASTGVGLGAIYDLNEHFHLMASAGPGLQNTAQTDQAIWYAALLFSY
jgi:opacity protein-like surface antigen